MKKFLLTILAFVLCLPTFTFVGCGTNNYIDVPTYFKEVRYSAYNSSEQKTTVNEFTHNNHDNAKKFTNITFYGNNEWLYKMTLETVSFDIYSNINEEVEFTLRVTNLKNGNQANNGMTSVYQKTLSPILKKNQKTTIKFSINDIINSMATETKIEIIVDASYFTGDNQELDFKFDILNFKISGEHK